MKKITDTAISRRGFLKKVAYTAPTIIALGTLTAPITAQASSISTPPPPYEEQPALIDPDFPSGFN